MSYDLNSLEQKLRDALPEGVDFDDFVNAAKDRWDTADVTERELMELKARGRIAGSNDTPDGFSHFYWCCTRRELPRHALYAYIVPVYYAKGKLTREELKEYYSSREAENYRFIYDEIQDADVPKIGVIIQASRELIKTTAVTIYFTAFRMGQEPHRANLLVQVGDDIAKDNTAAISRIIDEFQGWKACFPNVVPDRNKGWGDKGYEIRRTDASEEEWNQLNADRKDPSLLGVGYGSHSLIGKHPSGVFVVDDIHDEKNTSSYKEMDEVLRIVESVMGYAFTMDAWVMYIGTPWVKGDTLDYIRQTGEYLYVKVPAYMELKKGKLEYPEGWDEGSQKVFMWEQERGEEWLKRKLNTTRNMSEFYRMILLNLEAAGERYFTFKSFPHREIRWDEWDITAGVDPSGEIRNVTKGKGISHFAIAYILETPYNNAVIGGGFLQKAAIDAGERELSNFQREHPSFRGASIESDGRSAAFVALVTRNVGLRWSPHSVRETGVQGGKQNRHWGFLGSLFSNRILLVSDEDTPFLNAIREYLARYPNVDDNAPYMDAMDAVVMAVLDIPRIWTSIHTNIAASETVRRAPGRKHVDVGRYHYAGGIH